MAGTRIVEWDLHGLGVLLGEFQLEGDLVGRCTVLVQALAEGLADLQLDFLRRDGRA